MDREQSFNLVVQCGLCRQVLGLKETEFPEQNGKVSHGLCDPCFNLTCSSDEDEILDEARDFFDRIERVKAKFQSLQK